MTDSPKTLSHSSGDEGDLALGARRRRQPNIHLSKAQMEIQRRKACATAEKRRDRWRCITQRNNPQGRAAGFESNMDPNQSHESHSSIEECNSPIKILEMRVHHAAMENLMGAEIVSEKNNASQNASINAGTPKMVPIIENPLEYYQELTSNAELKLALEQTDSLNFDIFEFCEQVGREVGFLGIAMKLYDKYDLMEHFQIEPTVFINFFTAIQNGYNDITYHNDLHGADVAVTSDRFLSWGLKDLLEMNKLEIFAFLTAGLVHDFRHPGVNNPYLIKTKHTLALRYNDISVLENMHISEAFGVMQNQEANLLQTLDKNQYNTCRKLMIKNVLATDMEFHRNYMEKMKERMDKIQKGNYALPDKETPAYLEEKTLVMGSFIHAADISNPAKPYGVFEKWSYLLFEEFFAQGDLEKSQGLEISMLCDRTTINLAKSQIGFIDFVVKPYFETLAGVLPQMSVTVEEMNKNKETFKEHIDHFEHDKKEENKFWPNPIANIPKIDRKRSVVSSFKL